MFERLKNVFGSIRRTWQEISSDGYTALSVMRNWRLNKSRRDLLDEFKNLVHQCITTITANVARYEPIAYRVGPDGKKVPVKASPLIALLKRPNPMMSQYDFIEACETYRNLSGEFFIHFGLGQNSGKPKEMYLISPDRVRLAIDKETGEVVGAMVRRPDGLEMPLDLNEFAHYKTFNPGNMYRGLGVVEANLLYVEIENTTSGFQYNYMKNQATPSGVLTFRADNKQTIDKDAFLKAKAQWNEQYSGEENAGKTLFVREMDVKFEKVGLSLADLDMAGLKEMTDQKVRNAFKVPKAMLGETDSSGLGRGNVEAIEYVFAKYTIDPIQNRYDDFFTMLANKYWPGDSIELGHVSQIPEDKEFEQKKNSEAVNVWKTINEVRMEEGKEAIDGGDTLYVPFNVTAINAPAPAAATGKKLVISLKQLPEVVADKPSALKKSTDGELAFHLALQKIEKKAEKDYDHKLGGLIDEQHKDVLSRLADFAGKAFDQITPDAATTAAAWTVSLAPVLEQAIEQSGPLTLDYLNVKDQIDFILNQGARKHIYESTTRLMTSFNQELTEKLQKQLIQGINNKESIAQLTKRVNDVYTDAKTWQAKRIANTESHRANNFGVREAFKSAGVKRMVWRANPNACEFCQAMDGQTAEVGGNFLAQGQSVTGTDGGSYLADYDNVQLADLHPNCACYIVPELD